MQTLSQVAETVSRLTVRVEPDGPDGDVRFVWTGGDAGLERLGLGRELTAPSGRGDVNPVLIPRLGKIHFLGHYAELVQSCWPKGRPGAGAVELQALLCAHEVVEAAREVTDAYNGFLHLGATVAGIEGERGHEAKGIQGLWDRTVEAARERDRSRIPPSAEWKEELIFSVSDSGVSAEFATTFSRAVRRAGSRLDGSARTLGDMVGREIISKVFLKRAETRPGPAVRPREPEVWTWPWTEQGDYSVLLGLLAMKLFENTAGDPDRWEPDLWFDRQPLQFRRALQDRRDFNQGGFLAIKNKWLDDGPQPLGHHSRPVSDLLREIAPVWQIYGRKKGHVAPDYLRGILTDGAASGEAGRLLRALEQVEKGAATSSSLVGSAVAEGRYLIPDGGAVLLQRFVPLLTAVAVDYEMKAGRSVADAPTEGG